MGGSGISPGWQILQEIDQNPEDKTKATLLFSNLTEKDILMKEKLDDLQNRKPDQFKIVYTVDKPQKAWKGHSGFVTPELLGKELPPAGFGEKTKMCVAAASFQAPFEGCISFVCGPPGQVAFVAGCVFHSSFLSRLHPEQTERWHEARRAQGFAGRSGL